MSTLKELFDKYGSVWLAHSKYPKDKYFRPMGYSESGDGILGESKNAFLCSAFTYDSEWFVLYEEPKPKVKRYQYKLTTRNGESYYKPKITPEFFKDDDELTSFYDMAIFVKFERLDSTMQEFDW